MSAQSLPMTGIAVRNKFAVAYHLARDKYGGAQMARGIHFHVNPATMYHWRNLLLREIEDVYTEANPPPGVDCIILGERIIEDAAIPLDTIETIPL